MSDMDWTSARVFLAVARSGSLTAAADRLGMSQPTVSRHVQALEEQLGATLFVRHARGMRLTDRARDLAPIAERVDLAMEEFARTAARVRETVSGTVRLAASEIVGVEVIVPAIAAFRAEQPTISIELVLGNVPSDLTAGEADIAIRLYRPRVPELIARLVGSVETGLYASQAYLERHGEPASLDGLFEFDLVGFDSRGPMAEMFQAVDPRFEPDRFGVRTDSLTGQLAAARSGAGIAALQRPIAERYPELRRVLPDVPPPPIPFWIVTHEDLRDAPHVRVTWDWLLGLVTEYVG